MDEEKTNIQDIVQTVQTANSDPTQQLVQNDEKPPKKSAKKFRFMAFIVYPDNPAQMAAFKWLREYAAINGLITGGMYILHSGEPVPDSDEDKKDHYHVMIYRDIPLSGSWCGFGNNGRYRINAAVSWFGSHDIARADGVTYYKDYSEGLPVGLDWQTVPIIREVQGVQDAPAYATYMVHKRFCDRNKIQYDWNDLQYFGQSDRFRALFSSDDELPADMDYELRSIIKYHDICQGEGARLIDCIIQEGRRDLLAYVRKNGQYINFYLLNPRRG